VVAFQNFGEAISAVADGDLEKINEAMKKLSPSAQSVAREVGALLPMLRSFQRVVQEGFFAPLVGDFTRVVRGLFPALEKGFFTVSSALGRMVSGFADLFSSTKTYQLVLDLFASTGRIIDKISAPVTTFLSTMFSVITAGLPYIERFSAAMGKALDSFSAFINKSIEDGSFNTFVEEAITTVKELIALVKALGGLIGTIFGATEDEGHNFIKTLTDMITKLDEFLKTAEGQAALDALIFAVKALGFALGATLNTLIFFWTVAQNTLLALEMLGRGFVDLVDTVWEWIKKIPDAIEEFIGGIPAKVEGFFKSMFDRALQAIGIGVGLLLFAIQVLPGKIVDFIKTIPDRVKEALSTLGGIVASAFQTAVDFGWNIITTGLDAIVNFILSVPDRIRDLIPNFGNAGKNLIDSFMNGFRSVGNFIGDVAGDIVSSVKGFLNKAIDKINSGISTIDKVLPGDLGRIPRLEDGALIKHRPGGILANIGEGREDEVVAPLSKLEGMVGGQNITFGPGAINAVFNGAVPTVSEARQVGQAVGQGILDSITKRNMRVQVRAI
jgi:phage-related protein